MDSAVGGIGKASLVGGSVILWANEQWWFGESTMVLGVPLRQPRAGAGLEQQPQE